MRVLLINGSPNEFGCTYTALLEVSKSLEDNGIETDMFHIGTKLDTGCIGCGTCRNKGNRCVFGGRVNEALDMLQNADGLVVGTPVYFASPNGALLAFLDRMFYADSSMAFKPAAAVASARRAGTTASLDVINKYFTIKNMPVISSQYWNMVHGNKPEEVAEDKEGMQVMRTLGANMAWLLKSIDAGRRAGIGLPQPEPKVQTNFIR